MKELMNIIIAFIAFIIGMVSFTLGIDYLDPEVAHGLNPWIAFPITIGCLICIFLLLQDEEVEQESD